MTYQTSTRGIGDNSAAIPEHGHDADAIAGLHRVGDEIPKPRKTVTADAVQEAGRELVALGLPAARSTLMIFAAQDKRLGHMHDLVLSWLSYFTNGKSGYAFPSYDLLAKLCGCQNKTIRNTCSELAAWGYLLRTAGNEIGPHKRKGPSFAIRPGCGLDWAGASGDLSEMVKRAKAELYAENANDGPDHGDVSSGNVPDTGDIVGGDSDSNVPDAGDVAQTNGPALGDDVADQWPHSSGPYKNPGLVEPVRSEVEPVRVEREVAPAVDATLLVKLPSKGSINLPLRGELFDAGEIVAIYGVELPGVIRDAIRSRRSPAKAKHLAETVRKVLDAHISADAIADAMSQAIAKSRSDTASDILGTAATFVMNLPKFAARDAAKAAQSTQAFGGDYRPDKPDAHVAMLGSVSIKARHVVEIADRHHVTCREVEAVVQANARGFGDKTPADLPTLNAIDEHFRKVSERRARTATVNISAWRETGVLVPGLDDDQVANVAIGLDEQLASIIERRGSEPAFAPAFKPAHSSALEWARWFGAHRDQLNELFRGLVPGGELFKIAIIGSAAFKLRTHGNANIHDFLGWLTSDATNLVGSSKEWLRELRSKVSEPYYDCDFNGRPLADELRETVPEVIQQKPTVPPSTAPPVAPKKRVKFN